MVKEFKQKFLGSPEQGVFMHNDLVCERRFTLDMKSWLWSLWLSCGWACFCGVFLFGVFFKVHELWSCKWCVFFCVAFHQLGMLLKCYLNGLYLILSWPPLTSYRPVRFCVSVHQFRCVWGVWQRLLWLWGGVWGDGSHRGGGQGGLHCQHYQGQWPSLCVLGLGHLSFTVPAV